jgi:hypothetical protein
MGLWVLIINANITGAPIMRMAAKRAMWVKI